MEEQEKKDIDSSIYKKFINSVKIDTISLVEMNLKEVRSFSSTENVSVELNYSSGEFETFKNELICYPKCSVKGINEQKENNKVVFEIISKFKIVYLVEELEQYDNKYLQAFSEMNVPVNVWPYFRELFSSMTTRMGYSALVIEPFTS